jgi:hypothetical protein
MLEALMSLWRGKKNDISNMNNIYLGNNASYPESPKNSHYREMKGSEESIRVPSSFSLLASSAKFKKGDVNRA